MRLWFLAENVLGAVDFGDIVGQELQGDKSSELDVLRALETTPMPPPPKLFHDAIVRNFLADHGLNQSEHVSSCRASECVRSHECVMPALFIQCALRIAKGIECLKDADRTNSGCKKRCAPLNERLT